MKEIVLGGGCFWGVEAYMARIPGIVETKVGYANGYTKNPTYEQVKTSGTGHAEVCYIQFDEAVIDLGDLLKRFWKIIDPTILNRQGPDIGSQYRTGIYYVDAQDLPMILETKEMEQKKYEKPIVTEIEPLKVFYEAEDYHQKYLEKNPNGYCHIDLSME